jgi:hypothetical protein
VSGAISVRGLYFGLTSAAIFLSFLPRAALAAGGAGLDPKTLDPKTLDPKTQCLDGGLSYRVGTHLCTSEGVVVICLRPDLSYGVKGIYVYDRNAKDAVIFDKAHWVSTTSSRCGRNDKGKVYFSRDPKR